MVITPLCARYSKHIDVFITAKTFSKRIVLNLQLSNLKDKKIENMNPLSIVFIHVFVCMCAFSHCVVLVGRDGDEDGLRERVCTEHGAGGTKPVLLISLHYV